MKSNLLSPTRLTACPTCRRPFTDEIQADRVAAEIEAAQASRDRSAAADRRRVWEEGRRDGMATQESVDKATIETLTARLAAAEEAKQADIDTQVEQRVAAKELTHERQMADLRRQMADKDIEHAAKERRWKEDLEKMQRRAEAKHPDDIGIPAQHNLRLALEEALPGDKVTETKRGKEESDVFVDIYEGREKCAGATVESKNNAGWSWNWIAEVKADVARRDDDLGILSVNKMPSDYSMKEFVFHDGIYIVRRRSVVDFVTGIRPFLVEQHKMRLAGRNTDAKGEALLNYVNSPQFTKMFAAQTFTKLRASDNKVADFITKENRNRNKLYEEDENLRRDARNAIDRILKGDDDGVVDFD